MLLNHMQACLCCLRFYNTTRVILYRYEKLYENLIILSFQQNRSLTRISLSSPTLTPATPDSTCRAGPVEAVQSAQSHWSSDQKVSDILRDIVQQINQGELMFDQNSAY